MFRVLSFCFCVRQLHDCNLRALATYIDVGRCTTAQAQVEHHAGSQSTGCSNYVASEWTHLCNLHTCSEQSNAVVSGCRSRAVQPLHVCVRLVCSIYIQALSDVGFPALCVQQTCTEDLANTLQLLRLRVHGLHDHSLLSNISSCCSASSMMRTNTTMTVVERALHST